MFHVCFVGTTKKTSSKFYKHVVQHSIESTITTINPKVNYVFVTKVEEVVPLMLMGFKILG
jgi:hypothetical protein